MNMYDYKETWLPKLKNSVPKSAYGFPTCMYLVSLEGWRRGLELRFYLSRRRRIFSGVSYSLNDGKNKHFFNGSRGGMTSPEAVSICRNKVRTNAFLKDANIPIPEGSSFSKYANNKDILKYGDRIGYPLVLKPIDGGGGVGVVTNIKNAKELEEHLFILRGESGKPVILERHFAGEDFRITVLNGKVIGAYQRRALSVVGNNKNSLKQLLHKKNRERKLSPFLANKLIKLDRKMVHYLHQQGLSPNYIPQKGERVYLRRNGEFFGQRESVNVTESLSSRMKNIALSAVRAIPGINFAGVDMLIDVDQDEGVVNEVNSKPQISNHVFPMEGEAIDIPKIIIDYYFPDTKENQSLNISYYYDYTPIIQNFRNGTASEVKIPSIYKNERLTKKFNITSNRIKNSFLKQIQKQAIACNIDGYVKKVNSEVVSIVASGNTQSFKRLKEMLIKKDCKINEEEEGLNNPVKMGFEIKT